MHVSCWGGRGLTKQELKQVRAEVAQETSCESSDLGWKDVHAKTDPTAQRLKWTQSWS